METIRQKAKELLLSTLSTLVEEFPVKVRVQVNESETTLCILELNK